jgi:hypothetical protein
MGITVRPRAVRQPAYKQRRRMRERDAFIAAVQARTHRPAAVLGGWVVEFGAVGNHPPTVPTERGGAEGCEVGGMACSLVSNVVPGEVA